MIRYLLWLCHRGKGSSLKYGIRSQLKSCKMNTSGHEESIKSMFFCMELCLLFSAGQLINSMRRWCRHLGRPPDTEPWSFHWNQWTLIKSKIPVTINMKIHANQAPAISFVYVFYNKFAWICLWRFCEIKWFEFCFKMPMHTCLFVCLCTCLFESMLMFMLECTTAKETLENSFINTENIEWLTKLGSFLQLFNFDLTPHFKALHLYVSHNHNKLGIIWQKI